MPRQVRIEYEDALYHVMARGNRRNSIFASPEGADEVLFLKTLGECCERTGFRIWAWVLMDNQVVKHRRSYNPGRLGNPELARARKERYLRRQAEQLGFALTPVHGEVS